MFVQFSGFRLKIEISEFLSCVRRYEHTTIKSNITYGKKKTDPATFLQRSSELIEVPVKLCRSKDAGTVF